jgi:hypothetical protein
MVHPLPCHRATAVGPALHFPELMRAFLEEQSGNVEAYGYEKGTTVDEALVSLTEKPDKEAGLGQITAVRSVVQDLMPPAHLKGEAVERLRAALRPFLSRTSPRN